MLVPVSKFVNGDVFDGYDSIRLIEDSGMNDTSTLSIAVENGGAIVGHGSGGMLLLRAA